MAVAYFFKTNFEKALEFARGVIARVPTHPVSLSFAAASLVHLGKLDEARATIQRLRLAYPNAATSNWRGYYRYPWMRELLTDALRRAALPE